MIEGKFDIPDPDATYIVGFSGGKDSVATGLHREGIAIERYRSQLVKSHVGHAREVDLAGHRVPVVACTTGEIISDVAGKLAEGRPYAACYFDDGDYRVFSLRSRADGVDVSQIATSFGGGGHKHAAGFRIPN